MRLAKVAACTICKRCKIGTTLHMFWECPVISNFWTEVLKRMSWIIGTLVPLLAALCLLKSLCLSNHDRRLLKAWLSPVLQTAGCHTFKQQRPLKEPLQDYMELLGTACYQKAVVTIYVKCCKHVGYVFKGYVGMYVHLSTAIPGIFFVFFLLFSENKNKK